MYSEGVKKYKELKQIEFFVFFNSQKCTLKMKTRTQVAQRLAGANAPLLLKFRVNTRYTETIADILNVRNRSKKEEYELTKKRVAEVGKDEAFAYQRTDAVGNKQADTGTEMFYEGDGGNALTFANMLDDMKENGYNLIDVHSYQKNGDRMSFIVFSFNKEKTAGFPPKVYALLRKLSDMSWLHVHIWDNPNGSITINAAHIIQEGKAPEIRMGRTDQMGMLKDNDQVAPEEGIYFTIHHRN